VIALGELNFLFKLFENKLFRYINFLRPLELRTAIKISTNQQTLIENIKLQVLNFEPDRKLILSRGAPYVTEYPLHPSSYPAELYKYPFLLE